jgi:hypothetical protein
MYKKIRLGGNGEYEGTIGYYIRKRSNNYKSVLFMIKVETEKFVLRAAYDFGQYPTLIGEPTRSSLYDYQIKGEHYYSDGDGIRYIVPETIDFNISSLIGMINDGLDELSSKLEKSWVLDYDGSGYVANHTIDSNLKKQVFRNSDKLNEFSSNSENNWILDYCLDTTTKKGDYRKESSD